MQGILHLRNEKLLAKPVGIEQLNLALPIRQLLGMIHPGSPEMRQRTYNFLQEQRVSLQLLRERFVIPLVKMARFDEEDRGYVAGSCRRRVRRMHYSQRR